MSHTPSTYFREVFYDILKMFITIYMLEIENFTLFHFLKIAYHICHILG